jgi:hypothetical protein
MYAGKKLILCKYSVKNKEISLFDGIFKIKKCLYIGFTPSKIENTPILTEQMKEKCLKKSLGSLRMQKLAKILPSKIQNFKF